MIELLFNSFLRLPPFRGKARLIGWLRCVFYPRRTTTVLAGLQMHLDPWEWLQLDIRQYRATEPLTTALFQRLLRDGHTYVDVGAHVGFHTLVARKLVGSSGRVLAIEPQPYNCERIVENWRANGFSNLVLFPAAAGRDPNWITLPAPPITDRAKFSLVGGSSSESGLSLRIPVLRLDEVLRGQEVANVRLLKIDVEGFEFQVLEGLGQMADKIGNIVLEILPGDTMSSGESLPVLGWLRQRHFVFRTVEGKEWHPGRQLPENNLWATRVGIEA